MALLCIPHSPSCLEKLSFFLVSLFGIDSSVMWYMPFRTGACVDTPNCFSVSPQAHFLSSSSYGLLSFLVSFLLLFGCFFSSNPICVQFFVLAYSSPTSLIVNQGRTSVAASFHAVAPFARNPRSRMFQNAVIDGVSDVRQDHQNF